MNHAARPVSAIELEIAGLGVVFFSPAAVGGISEGEDYLGHRFTAPADVAAHVNAGTISCLCLGSPGRYTLNVFDGEPPSAHIERAQFKVRLTLEVRGGQVHFRDLYDLMHWRAATPPGQVIALADGFYSIAALSSVPASGVAGDEQGIDLSFKRVSKKPELTWKGVPLLCE